MSTRDYSSEQEKHIAKLLDGRVTPNSGGTKFGGGDVIAKPFLIEAKTTTKEKESFTIKKEWLDKARHQAFEQGLEYSALAFQFEPDGKNYFVVAEGLFKLMYLILKEWEDGQNTL